MPASRIEEINLRVITQSFSSFPLALATLALTLTSARRAVSRDQGPDSGPNAPGWCFAAGRIVEQKAPTSWRRQNVLHGKAKARIVFVP